MNNILMKSFGLSSKNRTYVSFKDKKRFESIKYKKDISEKKPLFSLDTDDSSEEEVIHDAKDIKFHDLEDEIETSASCLRKINKKEEFSNGSASLNSNITDPFNHCEFLCLKIEEGDTLQSISIKYHCSISDIKRANNLISSQEFYGLKYLKIPVKKHSILTEVLPRVTEDKSDPGTIVEEYNNVRTINIGIGLIGKEKSPEEAAAFFKRMDEDLVKIMLSTKSKKDSLEAAAVALTTPRIQPLVKDPYNSVDCGIQWNYLIIFVIIAALIIPTAIALYMYMKSSHEHHTYSNTSSTNETLLQGSTETYNSTPKLNLKSKN